MDERWTPRPLVAGSVRISHHREGGVAAHQQREEAASARSSYPPCRVHPAVSCVIVLLCVCHRRLPLVSLLWYLVVRRALFLSWVRRVVVCICLQLILKVVSELNCVSGKSSQGTTIFSAQPPKNKDHRTTHKYCLITPLLREGSPRRLPKCSFGPIS